MITCPCGAAPRRPTPSDRKGGIKPRYCVSCSLADDQRPQGYDLLWPQPHEPNERTDQLAFQAGLHAALFSRADDLRWSGTLTEAEQAVWDLFCDGVPGFKKIAKRLGTTEYAVRQILDPLKARCGFKAEKPYVPKKRRK